MMLTFNKLKIIAVKNLLKSCVFIFLIISLCLIYTNSNKYEKTLIQLEKKEIEYLNDFANNEEDSKLRVSQWLFNKTDDFKKIIKIRDYLIHFGGLLRKAPSYTQEEAEAILATPGSEYRNKKNKSKNKKNWPSTETRSFPLDVSYDFGTFVPGNEFLEKADNYNKKLVLEDKLRFASFINEITLMVKKYNVNKKTINHQNRTEYSSLMYGVFGILEDIEQYFPELEILWIYVGSSEGAFATFPGNGQEYWNQSDSQPYNPTNRPWFKEAINSKGNNLFSNSNNIGLSSVYDDYSEHLNSVRTLWHKVEVDKGKRTYIIGIDFYLSKNAFSVGISDLIDKKNIPSINNMLIIEPLRHSLIISFLFFVFCLIFLFFGPIGFTQLLVFGFSTHKSPNGNIEILAEHIDLMTYDDSNNNSIKFQEENKKTDKNLITHKSSFRTSFGRFFNNSISVEKTGYRQKINMIQAAYNQEINSLSTGIRGKEFWKIIESKRVLGSCPTCGEAIKTTPDEQNWEQILVINHVAQDIPEVLTLLENGGEPQEWIKNSLIEHILKSNQYIDRSNNLQKRLHETTRFKIPYQLRNYPPLTKMQNDYHVLQSGRYNSRDMMNLSKHLYQNSNVNLISKNLPPAATTPQFWVPYLLQRSANAQAMS